MSTTYNARNIKYNNSTITLPEETGTLALRTSLFEYTLFLKFGNTTAESHANKVVTIRFYSNKRPETIILTDNVSIGWTNNLIKNTDLRESITDTKGNYWTRLDQFLKIVYVIQEDSTTTANIYDIVYNANCYEEAGYTGADYSGYACNMAQCYLGHQTEADYKAGTETTSRSHITLTGVTDWVVYGDTFDEKYINIYENPGHTLEDGSFIQCRKIFGVNDYVG